MRGNGFTNLRSQAGRFAALGIIINAAGFLLYFTLVEAAGLKPSVGISIVYIGACICSYMGNRGWTFRDRSRVSNSMPKYFIVQVIGYVTNLGIMGILNGKFGIPHAYVQFVAITIVALLLFLLNKYVVFAHLNINE